MPHTHRHRAAGAQIAFFEPRPAFGNIESVAPLSSVATSFFWSLSKRVHRNSDDCIPPPLSLFFGVPTQVSARTPKKKKERRQNTTIRAAADPFWQRPKKEAATRTVELLERILKLIGKNDRIEWQEFVHTNKSPIQGLNLSRS